jgi:hypothetical protein
MNANVAGLEVVLTDRVSVLSGSVRNERNQSVVSKTIVVFSTERDQWYWSSRFLRLTTSDADSRSAVQGLPFGSYYVAVVSELPNEGEDAWQAPDYLDALSRTATTATVRDGELTTLDVRVAR